MRAAGVERAVATSRMNSNGSGPPATASREPYSSANTTPKIATISTIENQFRLAPAARYSCDEACTSAAPRRWKLSVVNSTHMPTTARRAGISLLPRRSRNTQMSALTSTESCARTSLYAINPRRGIGAVNSIETSAGENASALRSEPKSHVPLRKTISKSGASASLVLPRKGLGARGPPAEGRSTTSQKYSTLTTRASAYRGFLRRRSWDTNRFRVLDQIRYASAPVTPAASARRHRLGRERRPPATGRTDPGARR